MNHHIQGPHCPLCEEKIATAHPYFQMWWQLIKKEFPDCHISWAWRNEADQNAFAKMGKSKAVFPSSPHNFTKDGKPCSLALDLFQIGPDKVARFNPGYYFRINQFLIRSGAVFIEWSGTWKGFLETNHFQLKKNVPDLS